MHPFLSSAAQSSSAKCACSAQILAPTPAQLCPSFRRRSASSAHSADATCSPATRIGDARRLGGTTGGARGASQVVAAPHKYRVRALCDLASTPAALCAPPSSPLEFWVKFGGASEANRLKSLGEGHARRLATYWVACCDLSLAPNLALSAALPLRASRLARRRIREYPAPHAACREEPWVHKALFHIVHAIIFNLVDRSVLTYPDVKKGERLT